ncbi:MAG TPA: FAD-binding oxidoreductase [Steroidobacteraceae bacterium]
MSAQAITSADVVIIGGGIAGAGAAYEIAAFADVVLLERESVCGYHATARSAASFTENYGHPVVRRLAMASRAFLQSPPEGFCGQSLLSPRGMLTIARHDQLDLLATHLRAAQTLIPDATELTVDEALVRVPVLRREYVAAAFLEPRSMDVDVQGLHQGFLRGAKSRGAKLVTGAELSQIEFRSGSWHVTSSRGAFSAPILINAAGAWADALAHSAGLRPLGLVPKRRTAFMVPAPMGVDTRAWPLVDDVGDEFYFKPDAGQLLVSPSDETPVPPGDAVPDDLDVAVGVDRLERATTINVQRVARAWAGLRTFASDGVPVAGFDTNAPGFFWLAGQGGYGIKTSPGLSRLCAALIRGRELPEDLIRGGIRAADLSPARLSAPAAPRLSNRQDTTA